MNLLLIVHAVSWSDTANAARVPITRILNGGGFQRVIELVPADPEIRASRYLVHEGEVLEHAEISPVPFLRQALLGAEPLLPAAENVVLVGGQLNSTGGGCLNVVFEYLVSHLSRQGVPGTIVLPMHATYSVENPLGAQDSVWTRRVAENLAEKMIRAGVRFGLSLDDLRVMSHLAPGPQIQVIVDRCHGGL